MPLTKKTYRQIAKDVLTQICGGEVTETYAYKKGKNVYLFSNTPVSEVKSIVGTCKGIIGKLFVREVDFRVLGDSFEWLFGGERPDDNTVFTVQYVFTRSSGISDVKAGSVTRTIVEAISREIEYSYLQMEQAYLSGFLDTATGNALDLVVSIIGVKRKPPQPSSGSVTFGRNTEPELLSIVGEVHLYDGSVEYALNKPLIKDIVKIEGTCKGSPVTFGKDVDYAMTGKSVRWLQGGDVPDAKTVFRIDYSAYREITIPKGVTVATFSTKPEETHLFETAEEMVLAQTAEAKWEAEVLVRCTVPGWSGNVLAGSVVVMPQPVPGVEYVINKSDLINGIGAEEDTELRERARHALEFAGKATYPSLESAIKSVEGVRSLLIEDMPDGVPGLVKVIVDGGNMDEILRVIDDTRAAGIKVEVSKPTIVYVSVSLTLMLESDAYPTVVVNETEKRIRSYISTLGIGDHVLYSRIVESVVSLDGVWDLQDVTITAYRDDGSIVESEKENIEISSEERAEPRNINISFEMRK
jgi:uncharacterized phage protein gp47/JayE